MGTIWLTARHQLEQNRIEAHARPPLEYVFYVEFLRGDDEAAGNTPRHPGEVTGRVKVLGICRAV